MRAVERTSKMWVWGAVAALTVGLVGIGGPATAAPPATSSTPVATASVAVREDGSVTVTHTINRAVNQVTAVSCTLDDGDPFACGNGAVSTNRLTTCTSNLSGLADGLHVFAVTFTLSDGGTATAAAQFFIGTEPPTTLEEACATLVVGGTVTREPDEFALWICSSDSDRGLQQPGHRDNLAYWVNNLLVTGYDELREFCPNAMGFLSRVRERQNELEYIQWTCSV